MSAPVAGAACPTRPADLDPAPTDAVVAELHALRQDVADQCTAVVEHVDAAAASAGEAARGAASDARAVVEAVSALEAAQGEPVALVGGTREAPLYVLDTATPDAEGVVALSDGDREALHEDAEQQRFALWFLAGLGLVVLVAPLLRRVWWP